MRAARNRSWWKFGGHLSSLRSLGGIAGSERMREWCEIFNIPEEIATDGGPQMTSTEFKESLSASLRTALLIAMLPKDMQISALQQVDLKDDSEEESVRENVFKDIIEKVDWPIGQRQRCPQG